MPPTLKPTAVEHQGTIRSNPFHGATKADVVACLKASIESWIAARQDMSRERLAEEICGISRPYFTKLENGDQGDVFDFVFNKLPGEIKDDFIGRLQELRSTDAYLLAVEAMVIAAFRVIRHSHMPGKATHMAHAELPADSKARTA